MRHKGFTLVEILVVVVIMAIMVSIAVLSIGVGGRDQQIDQEGRRLVGLLGLLHDRALLEGRDFGLLIEPEAYEFLVYDDVLGQWRPFDTASEFRRRSLPKGLSLQLALDSQQVVLTAAAANLAADAPPPAPQLVIAASGDGTPFRLTLLRAATGAKAIVSGDALGKISLAGADHPASAS
ncbi:MAG TPA: type II secretion system minor pseudopilin GspH [Steroidobacteraceae bacterium]|nr:type II secretion system minor pseudopilin GspH [Steroidobacteraceae bacterium]